MSNSRFAVRIEVALVEETCGRCMMIFAVPAEFKRQCVEKGRDFRCPNPKCEWNSQSYSETKVQKLEREIEQWKASNTQAIRRREWAESNLEAERNSHRSTRGHLTRSKRRASVGVCPCCNRSFKQLRRHMRSKHPDFMEEETDEPEIAS